MKERIKIGLILSLFLSLFLPSAIGPQNTANILPGQSTTLLPDGRWLLVGGEEGPDRTLLATASIWDPRTGVTTLLSSGLQRARAWHTATLLPDGTILVFGGVGSDQRVTDAAEVFNPVSQSFESLVIPGLTARGRHTSTLLTDGRVLIAGGMGADNQVLGTAELWDSRLKTVETSPAGLTTSRQNHRANLLADGGVLLWGGIDQASNTLENGEIYRPEDGSFTLVQSFAPRDSTDPPELATSLPEDGAVDVVVDSLISLRFSKPLRVDTVNTDTLTLSGPNGIERIKVVPAEGGMLAFITPESSLLAGATYTVTLNGALDVAGSLLPVSGFTFTTQSSSLSTQPSGGITTSSSSSSSETQNPKSEIQNLKSDDFEWRGEWRDGKPYSRWQDLSPLQADPGVTALAGQVLDLQGDPLANVTLQIEYGSYDISARTDESGRFLLKNIESGWRELIIDGRLAHNPKSEIQNPKWGFGVFEYGLEIKFGETNVLPFTIWLPKIDTANTVKISSPTTSEVVVTTPRIPGLEVRIPPGTVIYDHEYKIVTEVGITPIPVDRTPFPLARNIDVPLYFTAQPGGAYIYSTSGIGARIIYPNRTIQLPGAIFNFWHYDPEGPRGWYIYGQATVSEDGKQVVPDPGVSIYEFTGAMFGGPNPGPPGPPPCPPGQKCGDGEPVNLATGIFVMGKTDLSLPDVFPIQLTRTYRAGDVNSRTFGIGTTHPYNMFFFSANQWFEVDLILPDGGRVHYTCIAGADCSFWTTAQLEHTSTQSKFYKSKIVWNGAGWDLTLKDGTVYIFAENAPLKAIRDRHGNQITISRPTANGNITQITSPNGRWIQFSYDASNRITQAQDNIGRTVNSTYDASGRLSTVTDPNGGVTTYTYDASHRMLTMKDARQIVFLTNEYDANGRVFRQTQPDGSIFQFAYTTDANGKITQTDVTDPRGNVRRVKFNADGQITEDTRVVGTADEQKTTYELQVGTNLALSVTDALARKTAYTYDTMGNVLTTTRLSGTPQAVTTTFTYEPTFNQVATITDPLNHTTTFAYDTKGNLISVTNPLNQTTTIAYNTAGQPISVTDPLNNATQFTYDFGDLVAVTDPLGNSTTRFIDAAGRLLALTNPLSHLTLYDYDPLNRLTKVTDPLNGPTNFGYDPNGNLLNVTDAKNQATSYTYDNMDRLGSRTDPLLKAESYAYDLAGNLSQFTDRKPQATTYEYDALNRRTRAIYADLTTTTYTYDKGNRLTQVNDSISGLITRTYDGLNRLTSETTPQGSVSYTYDAAGRRTSMTVAGQSTINYAYDNANRLTQITQGSSIVSFAYDAASRRTSLTLPNGVLVEYTYDVASRVTEIKYKKGATTLGNLTYSYDKAGNRTKTGGTFARTGLPTAVSTSSYNAANQQTALGDNTMTFDNNGNLTGITDASGTTIYSWNARNQLTGISGPGMTASFVYDGLGRREKKTVNSILTEFLYDGVNPVQETSGATVLANILTGLGIDEFFTRTDVPAATTSHFLSDALGSALALADSAGAVQTEYTYEPFGKTTATGVSNTNPFQYTGRENDATGLYYYRGRYYHPILQRFITEDPLCMPGGMNLYAYVRNNPLRYTDPFGLEEEDGGSGSSGSSDPGSGEPGPGDGGGNGGMGGRKDPVPPEPPGPPRPPRPRPPAPAGPGGFEFENVDIIPDAHTKKDCYDAWRHNMGLCNALPPPYKLLCQAAATSLLTACILSAD